MADQVPNKSDDQSKKGDPSKEEQSEDRTEENSEWLRDQTGEDHNLSGSSTYRTLPDQPEPPKRSKDSGDATERQSNR